MSDMLHYPRKASHRQPGHLPVNSLVSFFNSEDAQVRLVRVLKM